MLQFSSPELLLLLVLVALPWWRSALQAVPVPSLDILPEDMGSKLMSLSLKIGASLAIALLCCALAGPYRPAHSVMRTGEGAEVMLLLDRSRSMDRPFYTEKGARLARVATPYLRQNSKGGEARRVLSEFVAARSNDRFGMMAFSNRPIEVLPLTGKQALVQAAIDAGNIGRGLAETGMASALLSAISVFKDRPYTGSRIVMLISDGAAELKVLDRVRIEDMLARFKVSLYWIYIRSTNSVDLFGPEDTMERAPQQAWHRFFSQLKTPYNVYTAESSQDLKRAIDDVDRLQQLPILYDDITPRRDQGWIFYLVATLLLGLLTLAALREVRIWR